jgi:two-component system NtrC family sensor kinase
MASATPVVARNVQAQGAAADTSLSVHATGGADEYFVEAYRDVCSTKEAKELLSDQLSRERQVNASLEETVKARTDQLDAAHQQLVLHEKMSSLGRLVAGIAHELNNPINFVYGNVDFLEDYLRDLISLVELTDESEELGPDLKSRLDARKEEIRYADLAKDCTKLIESVRSGAERCASIVRDLNNFSRTSATSFHEFDLVRGVESTLNLIRPLIQNRIEIRRRYEEGVPLIHCNGGHINQVFMNLLANAAQAIEGDGVIDISIETIEAGEQVRIQVSDSGHGIAAENREKITDPFFTTKGVGEGSGLGLWVTLGIVHRHGGLLACKSEPGNGAVFTVTLPVTPGGMTTP